MVCFKAETLFSFKKEPLVLGYNKITVSLAPKNYIVVLLKRIGKSCFLLGA